MAMHVSNSNFVGWDQGRVAQIIDNFWCASNYEIAHRKTLAFLIKEYILPNNRLLEIGCGSGLVYNQLVPDILPNHAYVGVDISEAMLKIAKERFPKGNFSKDDLYALSFPDNSFEVVAALEVFGHIGDIGKPIREMFRTASRSMIFTVWTGPVTRVEYECYENTQFIHTIFAQEDVLKTIDDALQPNSYTVHIRPLSSNTTAYIINK